MLRLSYQILFVRCQGPKVSGLNFFLGKSGIQNERCVYCVFYAFEGMTLSIPHSRKYFLINKIVPVPCENFKSTSRDCFMHLVMKIISAEFLYHFFPLLFSNQ